jgi:hypothetical protein
MSEAGFGHAEETTLKFHFAYYSGIIVFSLVSTMFHGTLD